MTKLAPIAIVTYKQKLKPPKTTSNSFTHSLSKFIQNIKQKKGNNSSTTTQFKQILSCSITSGLFNDPLISSKLLLLSLSSTTNRNPSFSRSMFIGIRNPNVFAYNFMFKSYSVASIPIESVLLYNLMLKDSIFPDSYTFPFVLKACGTGGWLFLSKGQELHCLSFKLGFEFDVFVQNALISMYSSCSRIELARKVFDFMSSSVRDVVSLNSLISGYLHCNFFLDAFNVFVRFLSDSVLRVDSVTFVNALSACAKLGYIKVGKIVHCLILRFGCDLDVYLGSSLIDFYTKCRHLGDARKVFDVIPEKNLVCWTSMIVGYSRASMFSEAIRLFIEMQVSGVKTDSALIACVASACGHLGALEQGKWVHGYCEKNRIKMSISVKNAFIDMYSKCGDVERARKIFNESLEKDVYSWTSMITGLAMNGKSEDAMRLFKEMELGNDVSPNEVTFVGALSACSHGGFVEAGFNCFRAMTQTYNIKPSIEHYGCMVDLLGRANLLAEALSFIRQMPTMPDVVIWRSFLFACRSHWNVDLAELAMNEIEKLEPKRSEARLLLASTYAAASQWGDAQRVRKQRIEKQPGCSLIEIDGFVHEFFSWDSSHAEFGLINETVVLIHNILMIEFFESDV